MTTHTTLEQLRAARDWLAADPRRWSPRGWGERGGPRCAVGALVDVAEGEHKNAHRALLDAVKPEGFISIMAFNDIGAETVDDVLRVYDRAIEAEEAKLRSSDDSREEVQIHVPRVRENEGCSVTRVSGSGLSIEKGS